MLNPKLFPTAEHSLTGEGKTKPLFRKYKLDLTQTVHVTSSYDFLLFTLLARASLLSLSVFVTSQYEVGRNDDGICAITLPVFCHCFLLITQTSGK